MQISHKQISRAFTDWLTRYNDDPDGFEEYGEEGEYGKISATYLLKLIGEQEGK